MDISVHRTHKDVSSMLLATFLYLFAFRDFFVLSSAAQNNYEKIVSFKKYIKTKNYS